MRQKIGNVVVTSEAVVSAGMLVYTGLRGAVNVIGPVELHWPFFLYLAVAGFFGLVAINWSWVQALRQRKPNVLYALAPVGEDIYMTLRQVEHDGHWDGEDWGAFDLKLWQLLEGVRRIGLRFPIEHLEIPLSRQDALVLQEWLRPFVAVAKARDIRGARKLRVPE